MQKPIRKLPRKVVAWNASTCGEYMNREFSRLLQKQYAAGWADAQESRNQDDLNQLSAMAADLNKEKV